MITDATTIAELAEAIEYARGKIRGGRGVFVTIWADRRGFSVDIDGEEWGGPTLADALADAISAALAKAGAR